MEDDWARVNLSEREVGHPRLPNLFDERVQSLICDAFQDSFQSVPDNARKRKN